MGELSRRVSAVAPQAPGLHAGADEDVDDLTFTRTATTFADLGLPDLHRQQGVLATGIQTERDRVHRRRADGTYVRRAIAWSATRTRILIHRMEQQMARREDGRFQPRGEWVKTGSVLREAAQPAAARRGEVPHAPQPGTGDGDSSGGEQPFARAYEDLAVLPRPVRSSVLARAANPDHFYTTLLHQRRSTGSRYSLNLVRANAREGIVVVALRPEGAPAWQVSQYTYDFTPIQGVQQGNPAGVLQHGGARPDRRRLT